MKRRCLFDNGLETAVFACDSGVFIIKPQAPGGHIRALGFPRIRLGRAVALASLRSVHRSIERAPIRREAEARPTGVAAPYGA